MANPKSFPLVRGRKMRVTAVDGCCGPMYGPDNQIVTEGFVSVALTANITTPDAITVTNANGKNCVNDAPSPEFNGYTAVITFCDVNPCLFSMVTGQPVVLDANGEVAGFRMNSGVSSGDKGFALEVWMGVPGVACAGESGAFGYLLLPCLSGGVIGDFTIENAAVTFSVTGAVTKAGTSWGTGPYRVVEGADGSDDVLPDPLDPDDHLYVIFTTVAPPEDTDGCVALETPAPPVTGATAGTPGIFTPDGNFAPANFADLRDGVPNMVTATPNTRWTVGQYVQTRTNGLQGQAYWNGTAWKQGIAPAPPATGATQVSGSLGTWTPSGSDPPDNVASLIAGVPNAVTASPTSAWASGSYVQTQTTGTGGRAYWNGTAWTAGSAP